MEEVQYDFNNMCRVCRKESMEMLTVFVNNPCNDESPRIDEMLMACSPIKISLEDGLPNLICQSCNEQLINAYQFKQLYESTHTSLQEYLQLIKDNKQSKEATHFMLTQTFEEISNMVNEVVDNAVSSFEEVKNVKNIKLDPDEAENEECDGNSDYIQFLDNNQLLLTCRTCSKCFTTLDGLKCHKRLHTGSLFKCKECGKQYTRMNHLQRHELSHGRRKMHVCKICNKTLTRNDHLKRHLVTHLKDKPFNCSLCGRGFCRSEHLANHIKRCKGDRVHICDICNKGFNRPDSLEVHRRMHDNKTPILPTLENLDNIEEHYLEIEYDGPNDNEDFSMFSDRSDSDADQDTNDCLEPQVDISENSGPVKLSEISDVANLASFISSGNEVYGEIEPEDILESETKIPYFENDENCEQIEYKEEREDSDSNQSEYLPTKSVTRVKRRRGRPRKNAGRPRGRPAHNKIKKEPADKNSNEIDGEYVCSLCEKIFSSASSFEKHSYSHEDTKVHTCGVCNKQFARSNHLKRHMLSHSERKPYNCVMCSKSFNRRDHLMQHIKLHEKQEHECEICKRHFNRSDHLAKHKASRHNIGDRIIAAKKYQCSVCLKGFTTEKYRDIHMKGHMGDKEYQCRTCDKTFISKSHLTEHIKFHNENSKKFLCSECGQRFIRNDYLVIHMRRHRGEKPFKCQYCGKGFPRTTDLTVHERYHTGEKTHLCTICGRGFGRAYNLTVHMRTHTGEKPYQCTYCDAAFAQGNDLKAHVRRHTGERFQCDYCSDSFLMGYLLTQHKRTVHGLNVVSNIRRLQPVVKQQTDLDEPEPITIPLPTPVIPATILNAQIQAHLAASHLNQQIARP